MLACSHRRSGCYCSTGMMGRRGRRSHPPAANVNGLGLMALL